jgi:hypothetical protein
MITALAPTSGVGPQNVTYRVAAGPSCGCFSRQATLTIANRDFVVTQEPSECRGDDLTGSPR